MIDFKQNMPIRELTTFKVGLGRIKFLVEITDKQQIPELYDFAKQQALPVIVLGEGSNSIAPDEDLNAIIALNKIKGIEHIGDDMFKAGAGELLDDFVAFTTERGWCGLESLSGVPGTVGAGPIQNVGAYGQEIAQVLTEVEAYDTETSQFVTIPLEEGGYSYRDSIFKNQAKNRYFITSITVKLHHNQQQPPFYASLQAYVEAHQLTDFSPQKIREYTLAVRGSKIPDYKQFPSAGSFFKNAIVTKDELASIEANYGVVPFAEPFGEKFKIPTGWLIDRAGLKGQIFHGIKIDPNNALILLNDSAESFADLTKAKTEIERIIFEKFGVRIEQEPINIAI